MKGENQLEEMTFSREELKQKIREIPDFPGKDDGGVACKKQGAAGDAFGPSWRGHGPV